MAFAGAIAEHSVRYEAIGSESGYDPATMTGEAIFQTLHRLVIEEERMAF
jgi:hypothetical protein